MPTTADMCKAAIIALKDRQGSSLQAIKKYVLATYGKVRFARGSAHHHFTVENSQQTNFPNPP